MFLRTSNRKAISVVLTTMIILVASVVLGTGVVIYGTSLFQTGAQQEEISTQGIKVWVASANQTFPTGWGAAGVRNSGDKIISVDNILVRGATVPFSSWYVDANQTRVTAENYQSQFNSTGLDSNSDMRDTVDSALGIILTVDCGADGTNDYTTLSIDQDLTGPKPTLCLTQASGPQSLNTGQRMVVYFKMPYGVLTSIDSGSTISVSIFAGKTGAPTSVTVANIT